MTKRLFAAIKINLEKNSVEKISGFRQILKNEQIKWVEPENIHITLKFFGDTEISQIKQLSTVFKSVAKQFSPFEIKLEKLGFFGSIHSPRVIWIGIKNTVELVKMANLIQLKLVPLGYEKEEQEFKPHLTLGRMKEIKKQDTFRQLIEANSGLFLQNVNVSDLKLYESILQNKGPIYQVIEKYDLGLEKNL
jgi:2'-5' RNA ligase